MASIQIFDLYPTGSELFKDSESFMGELIDNALGSINGGTMIPTPTPNSPYCYPTVYSPLCKPSLPRPIRPTMATTI